MQPLFIIWEYQPVQTIELPITHHDLGRILFFFLMHFTFSIFLDFDPIACVNVAIKKFPFGENFISNIKK